MSTTKHFSWSSAAVTGSQVEPPRFGCCSLGGGAAGVTDEHLNPRPSGNGHQADLGSARREPTVGGGVAKPVRSEPLDADPFGTPAQRAVERI